MRPEPPYRHPTRQAINSLAKRFDLPNFPGMQDWEHEVASPSRLPEFLSVFEAAQLNDDEQFTLMKTIIESFEELELKDKWRNTWPRIEAHLRQNFRLHAYTIWYWARFGMPISDSWEVSAPMRRIYLQLSPDTEWD